MTMQLEFTPEILEVLNYERYRHPIPLVQRRMEALWLKSHGLPHGQIAQLVNITENTLRDYFQLYLEGGMDRLRRLHEARPQQQVLRRVARDRELREDDEVGLLFLRLCQPPSDPLRVAVEIADDGVDLGEREPHRQF